MAGANGPTSAAGTVDTPNPEGGPVEKPDADGKGAKPSEETKSTKDAPSKDQNEDG